MPFADADDFHPPANIAKMSAGHALNDDDRYPWLDAIGEWLADHCGDGGVMSCSALKRKYRDQLRKHCPQVVFLHLSGSPEVIGRRQASRPGHFMPASLLASQFDTLEPLEADEHGVVIDVDQDIDSIVENYLDSLHRTGELMTFMTGEAITILADDAPKLAEPVASGWQLILAFLAGIAVIVVLITVVKLHPFLALIFGALTVGIVAGEDLQKVLEVLRRRVRLDGGRRRHPDRAGRDVRQIAGRLRWCRRDRRHHRRARIAACPAVGDGAGRGDHRPADVLRDRPGAADAGDLPRCRAAPSCR